MTVSRTARNTAAPGAATARTRLGTWLGWVSGRGWGIVLTGLAAVAASVPTGWIELRLVGASFLIMFGGAVLLVLGRGELGIRLLLRPGRVVVGGQAVAQVVATNTGRRRIANGSVTLPLGADIARFTLPALRPGSTHRHEVTVPTTRRGVITVGPASSRRQDPFGLIQRRLGGSVSAELLVHPVTVAVGSIGSGLLRDLEGRTTDNVSTSDLAFHALRSYQPGDDVRHIHWTSSQKLTASDPSDIEGLLADESLLVRQFLDTRRSHLAVIVDTDPGSYTDEDEFEAAVTVAASVARRAAADGLDLTVVGGGHYAVRPPAAYALDVFARITADRSTLVDDIGPRLRVLSPGVSYAVVCSGARLQIATFARFAQVLAQGVTTVAVQVAAGSQPSVRRHEGLTVLGMGGPADLRLVLQGARVG